MPENAADIKLPADYGTYTQEQKDIYSNWVAQNPVTPPHVDTPEEIAAKEAASKTPEAIAAKEKEVADAETARIAAEEAVKYKDLTPEQVTAKKAEEKEAFDKTPEGIAKIEADRLAEEKKTSKTERTFEEMLIEKTAGKYKTLEEVEALIKPEKKFKSSIADRAEAYVEASGAETPEEIAAAEEKFFSTQTTDFTKMSNRELIEYKIQGEHPLWNDKQIAFEIKKVYGVDKWKTDVKEYEEGIEPEEIEMQKLSYEQDAQATKETFIAEQKKWAVPEKKVAPAPAAVDPKVKESYDKEIDAAFGKFDKLALQTTDEDNKPVKLLDYVMDAKDKLEISQIGKDLFSNAFAYWEKTGVITKDAAGKITVNKDKMAELIFKAKNFDKAISVATKQAYEIGKAKMVKEQIKNTNFTPGTGTKTDADKAAMNKKLAEILTLV
jgi:hypothetical protein